MKCVLHFIHQDDRLSRKHFDVEYLKCLDHKKKKRNEHKILSRIYTAARGGREEAVNFAE